MASDSQINSSRSKTVVNHAAKLTVIILIFLLISSGFADKEAWPLTAWRLFSHVRTDEQISWTAFGLTNDDKYQIDFGSLPRGYSGSASLLKTWPSMTQKERDVICNTWLSALAKNDLSIEGIRIYRTVRKIDPDNALRKPVVVGKKEYGGCDV